MAYTARDDWDGDEGRHDDRVHYRLFVGHPDGQAAVICVQDFDYLDLDARRILSPKAFGTEAGAEQGLIGLLSSLSRAEHALPDNLDPDLRARMLASLVRDGFGKVQR